MDAQLQTTVQLTPCLNYLFGIGVGGGKRESSWQNVKIYPTDFQSTGSEMQQVHHCVYVLRALRTGMGLCVLTTTPALCKLVNHQVCGR